MEELTKNPIFSWLVSAFILLAQLFLRSKMDELKKADERKEKDIDLLFRRTDEIPAMKKDIENFRKECERNHRK